MRGSQTNIRSAFRPAFPLFDRRSDSRMSRENWQTATWQCGSQYPWWNTRPKKIALSENIGYPQKIIVNHHFLHYSKLAIKQGHTPLPNKSQYGAGTIHLYQSTVHLGMARSIDPKTRMSSSYGHF